jgi:catechol 2,3-dioxygenase-like lactoylglutathione lyase family enzyme
MAITGLAYVHAEVMDLARSKRFYGETLGWEMHTDEKDVAGFAFGSGYLVLVSGRSSASPRSDALYVGVEVSEVDVEYARLKGLGVDVGELRDYPWGERKFSFRDPDGYLWSYGEIKGHDDD